MVVVRVIAWAVILAVMGAIGAEVANLYFKLKGF